MSEAIQPKSKWSSILDDFLQQHPDLKFTDDPEKLEYYRNDMNVDLPPFIRDLLLKSVPDIVLRPAAEDQIVGIFELARRNKIPLTIRGAGTWAYGGAVPTRGGILIDLGSMETVKVNPDLLQVTVGPGARFVDIEKQLEQHGLHLLSMASGKGGTLIGWMATGGMGLGTFRNGPIREQLVSMRVITPEGKTLRLQADDPETGYFLATSKPHSV
jgi:FAD/FMN-containing dehydrogenase